MTDVDFDALVMRVRAQDRTAAEELVRRFEPELQRRVRLLLTDRRLWATCGLSDVVQSVFRRCLVKLYDGNVDIRDPGQLMALLVTIGRNRITDHARRPHTRLASRALPEGHDVADDRKTPAEMIGLQELLSQALACMTEEEKRLLEQYTDGESWQAIGDATGMSADAARQKLNRARKRIKKKLRPTGDSGD